MIAKYAEMSITERANIQEGIGVIHCRNVFEKEALIGKTRYFARMRFKPGESIGAHPHVDNVEFYYILSGDFEVTEEGHKEKLQAGDAVMTGNGDVHSIINIGNCDGELLAIVIDN